MASIPITILTGFLGSGKTTILLNLIPQLPPNYRLALLKNEFGDVAVDSQLASASSISGVRELLNGCICCNLVGQLSDALRQLRDEVKPDRIVVETSGSAFPATLAMEVNRLARSEEGAGFVLDGVVSVVDVENWEGYEDTSYTAKLQAKYTDLIVFNKWEAAGERRLDVCLNRVGDLDVQTPWVKSDMGRVDKDVLLGIDGALYSSVKHADADTDAHAHAHQSEVEVLSATLKAVGDADSEGAFTIDLPAFETLLRSAPREEIYRIKGIVRCSSGRPPALSSDSDAPAASPAPPDSNTPQYYILNWAFGRWTWTPVSTSILPTPDNTNPRSAIVARLILILARYESSKWEQKLVAGGHVRVDNPRDARHAELTVERLL